MPCRHYESDDWGVSNSAPKLKAELDKMARVACAAMEELVRQGKEDFLILKNEEVRNWWEAHVAADRAEKARVAELERRERVKKEALDRLTEEEKELLGLNNSREKKKHKKHNSTLIDSLERGIDIEEYDIEELKKEFEKYSTIRSEDC